MESLQAVDILVEFLTSLKNETPKSDLLGIVPYKGPSQGKVYCEAQVKVETGFFPEKKNYVGIGRLN